MKSSLPRALILSLSFVVFHSPFLEAQSPLAEKWREVTPPPEPDSIARRSVQLPLPTPSPTPPASVPVFPSAAITFADGTQVKTQSTGRRFRLVGLHASEGVDITLDVPAVLLSSAAIARSLDGGTIVSFSMNAGGSGTLASLRFQAGARPGLYRVFVPGLAGPSLLQFWVADPNNPKAGPPVINPQH
jgi:hypothetical protein